MTKFKREFWQFDFSWEHAGAPNAFDRDANY